MAFTVFYSWQSDLDARVTRQLIRDSLTDAITQLANELALEDAIRLDQDTQGVPGMPDIANTILAKIEKCSVFVPDLSLVGATNEGSKTPNPNVLIELGYAMRAKADTQIVSVMNEAFGDAASLPFDLAHRRWPIRYSLPPGADRSILRTTRDQLASKLLVALRAVIQSGLPSPQVGLESVFQGTEPKYRLSSFLADKTVLVREEGFMNEGTPRPVVWRNSPQMFLRMIPTVQVDPPLSRGIVEKAANTLSPFGRVSGWESQRNGYGTVVYAAPDPGPNEEKTALIITQVFRTGEIWGINGVTLRKGSENPFVPSGVVIEVFYRHLSLYMKCLKDHLKVPPPIRFIAGLSGVKDYQIAVPSNYGPGIKGTCYDEDVIYEGLISNYSEEPEELLDSFFDEMWDSFGVQRPT